jgi:hypothetical protein
MDIGNDKQQIDEHGRSHEQQALSVELDYAELERRRQKFRVLEERDIR